MQRLRDAARSAVTPSETRRRALIAYAHDKEEEMQSMVWLSADHGYSEHRLSVAMSKVGMTGTLAISVRHDLRYTGPESVGAGSQRDPHEPAMSGSERDLYGQSVASLDAARARRRARSAGDGATSDPKAPPAAPKPGSTLGQCEPST